MAVALTLTVGAAWAARGPLALFSSNPQGEGASPGTLWDQDVVPQSVERAGAVRIPQHGTVEFWHADTRQGGWCGAIRLPDGGWAATNDGDGGGTAPGCYPTRAQTNGDDPLLVLNGFDYYEVQLDARNRGGSFWRLYYGIVTGERPVVSVLDRSSGRRATASGGGRFILAIPDADPERAVPLPKGADAFGLVAYDAAGHVVASEGR